MGGGRGQSHKHGLHGSQPHHASLSSAGTSGSHHLPFCLLRKRTHSPSSKDEQSIGLKDSLLAHSSDPVEMRRLNYQTPGKAAPSAGLPSPGLQAPGVSVEGPWPCAPFPFLCPSSCIIHLVEVTEEPLFPTAGQAPQGPGASQGKPRCLGFVCLIFGLGLFQIRAKDPSHRVSVPALWPLHLKKGWLMGNALSDTCGGVVCPHSVPPGGWPQLHRESSEALHRAWCLPFLPQPLSRGSLAIPSTTSVTPSPMLQQT